MTSDFVDAQSLFANIVKQFISDNERSQRTTSTSQNLIEMVEVEKDVWVMKQVTPVAA